MVDLLADAARPLLAAGAGPDADTAASDYAAAFVRDFLAHTDQKRRAGAWLARFAEALPDRGLLLDVGAGSGEIVRAVGGRFAEVVAIEPNPELAEMLRRDCPGATVIEAPLDEAPLPAARAGLTTLIHVLYYLPRRDWAGILAKLAATVAPGGALVAMLQRPTSDFQRLVADLYGPARACDLRPAALRAASLCGFGLSLAPEDETVAHVEAPDLETMVNVAAFVAGSVLDRDAPAGGPRPTRGDAARWIEARGRVDGGYRLSCDQEIAVLARPLP